MKRVLPALALALTLALAGCTESTGAGDEVGAPSQQPSTRASEISRESKATEAEEGVMKVFVDGTDVAVEWEENESVAALAELAAGGPLTIRMSMYGGFEQVGSLGTTLPRNDGQMTTGAGDIVLYSGNQIVVFYGSNSWAYTRLGHITDRTADELAGLLGNGDVALTITME